MPSEVRMVVEHLGAAEGQRVPNVSQASRLPLDLRSPQDAGGTDKGLGPMK